ncbi:MAG: hypothetical protein ACQEP9_01705 [Bacillota bacterium]
MGGYLSWLIMTPWVLVYFIYEYMEARDKGEDIKPIIIKSIIIIGILLFNLPEPYNKYLIYFFIISGIISFYRKKIKE